MCVYVCNAASLLHLRVGYIPAAGRITKLQRKRERIRAGDCRLPTAQRLPELVWQSSLLVLLLAPVLLLLLLLLLLQLRRRSRRRLPRYSSRSFFVASKREEARG